MKRLKKDFQTREELIQYVSSISSHERENPSPFVPSKEDLEIKLTTFNPSQYAKTRNFLEGQVSNLSPYISKGVILLKDVFKSVVLKDFSYSSCLKFFQELAWREYWEYRLSKSPHLLWEDAGPYKTGFEAADYASELPLDLLEANTDCACINQFVLKLYETGLLHNHARMYLAAYVVHFRRVKWQAGAEWFLNHLLDEYPPSNNLSWQWVASTLGYKPYIFNLENVQKYASNDLNTDPNDNAPLNYSYSELQKKLFHYDFLIRLLY